MRAQNINVVIMEDVIYVVGHKNPDTDSVCSAIAYANLKNLQGERNVKPARAGELNPETVFVLNYFKLQAPKLLVDATNKKLIIVDHNEIGQALANIDKAEIIEVWEHHRLGGMQTPKPIFFHSEPVGSTATLIAEQYFNRKIKLTEEIAGILLAAILSDTVIFKSPTCTEKDKKMTEKLKQTAGIDFKSFGMEMFKAKANIAAKNASDILNTDFKEFNFSGNKIGIGQIEVMDTSDIKKKKVDMLKEMEKLRAQRGLLQVVLMVTDIMKEASELWFVGEKKDIFEKAFGKKLKEGSIYLEKCMSRKKQVVPPLETAFKVLP